MNLNYKIKILFIIFVAILTIILFKTDSYAADPFTLDEQTKDVYLNGSVYLLYTGGEGEVTWESSDQSIATVENGLVTGLKVGTTVITATRGNETSSCTINVVYESLAIQDNSNRYLEKLNLILDVHPTEKLIAEVKDGHAEEVSNPNVTWTSSDESIVKVDSITGTITAVKPGTVTITATAVGVSDTCEVIVYNGPTFTDFSNAKYITALSNYTETLQITGIEPKIDNSYYGILTSNNTKPEIALDSWGGFYESETQNVVGTFSVNTDENYIYLRSISKYVELNQDLYLWIVEDVRLEDYYYNENGDHISHSTKFVVEGQKIERAELPKLNLILQSFWIGYTESSFDNETTTSSYIRFNFPSDTENRNFTLKIGKVTDSSILTKIQNNDYTGITDLLEYAKSHDAVYTQDLTTTNIAHFSSDSVLFNGRELLEDDAYYFIYVEFDDENGKYYPIEGVTLAQAWLSEFGNSWTLYAYTSSDFEWGNLSSTPIDNGGTTKDPTIANKILPNTGVRITLMIIIIVLLAGSVFAYFKYRRLKNI